MYQRSTSFINILCASSSSRSLLSAGVVCTGQLSQQPLRGPAASLIVQMGKLKLLEVQVDQDGWEVQGSYLESQTPKYVLLYYRAWDQSTHLSYSIISCFLPAFFVSRFLHVICVLSLQGPPGDLPCWLLPALHLVPQSWV